jgi:hypothetical protein
VLGEIKVGLSSPNKDRFFFSGKYREKICGTPDIQNGQTPQRKHKKFEFSFAGYQKPAKLVTIITCLVYCKKVGIGSAPGLIWSSGLFCS